MSVSVGEHGVGVELFPDVLGRVHVVLVHQTLDAVGRRRDVVSGEPFCSGVSCQAELGQRASLENEPDVRHVVVLGHDRVQELGADVAVLGLDLGGKVSEHDYGWLVRADEDRSDEQLKVRHPLGLAGSRGNRQEFSFEVLSVEDAQEAEKGQTHLGSAASNSRMTRSVLSGRWCSEQKAK